MAVRPATTRLAGVRAFTRAVRSATRPGSPGLAARVAAFPRMVSAIRRGEYLGASSGQLFTLLGAAAYVASPVDLLPEGLLGVFGLGDDAFVFAYAAGAFVNLTEDFLAWEAAAGAGAAAGPTGGGQGSPTGPTGPYHGPAAGFPGGSTRARPGAHGDTVEGTVLR